MQFLKAMGAAMVFICSSNDAIRTAFTTDYLGQRQGLKGELHFHAWSAQELLPVAPFWKIQELNPKQKGKQERKNDRLHLVKGL